MQSYILKCNNCSYTFESTEEWLMRLKCSAHKRYKGHLSFITVQGEAVGLNEGVRRL